MTKEREKFLIIDGNNLLYSSYYAFQKLPWKMSQGAIFLFLRVLISVLKKSSYQKLLVAFDGGGTNFRHALLPHYKAQRETMPEELWAQMEILKELFTKTNIAYIQLVNYEADDIIASFITQTSQQHPDTSFDIFTRDKDLLQLLSKNTNILKYISGKITLYTAEQFYQEYNFLPSSYVDYLSLIGDNIDNIEGVRGIGPVSANKLLQQFSTAENIFRNFATLSEPTNVKSLLAGKEELIYRNKKVISLDQSLSLPIVDCSFNWEKWKNDQELRKFCVANGFRSIVKMLNQTYFS